MSCSWVKTYKHQKLTKVPAITTHPLMTHFREEHSGKAQEILMRVISKHITPLERQVCESLNIIRASGKPEECLNLKSEWGGSKLPSLSVSVPKGVGGRKPGPETLLRVARKRETRGTEN